jgi:uncharacterized protein (DUF58 family)
MTEGRLARLARTLRSERALRRLNHILIPQDKESRDRYRRTFAARALAPLVVLGTGLSREGRALFGMTFLVGLAGLDVGQSQVYLLFAMLAGLTTASLVARPLFRATGVALEVEAPPRVTAGARMQLLVRLENRGTAPRLSLRVSGPFLPWDGRWHRQPEGVARLAPGERATVTAEASFLARGEHHLDAFEAAALTPLGLATGPRVESDGARFLVVPRRANVVTLALTHRRPRSQGASASSVTRGDAELATVRPYRAGDPIKHVHPRTWARTGEPHVRQWVDERSDRVGLAAALDGVEATEAAKESALSLVAGLASRIAAGGGLHTLALDGRAFAIAPRTGPAALDATLDRLATHAITDEALGDDVLAGALGGALSAVVLVTADEAPRRAVLVERLVRQGVPVRWIVVVPPNLPTRIERANGTPDRVSTAQIDAEEPLAL